MAKIVPEFYKAFNSYLQTKGLSGESTRKYDFFLNKFINRYEEINQKTVDLFITENQSSPARATIINLKKAILRWDFSPELKQEIIIIDIPKRTAKKVKPLPKFMKRSDIDLLDMKISLSSSFESERLKLMILVQFHAGLRVSELVGLTVKGLNFSNYKKEDKFQGILISSDSAKFGKERRAFLPTYIYQRMIQWYRIRLGMPKNIAGKPIWGLKARRYSHLFNKETRRILGETYNTHALRHGRGNDLRVNENKQIDFIKEYLGHASINSTQIYTHFSSEDVKEELEGSTEQIELID